MGNPKEIHKMCAGFVGCVFVLELLGVHVRECVAVYDLIQQVVKHIIVHPQRYLAAGDTKHARKCLPVNPVRGSEMGGKLRKRLTSEHRVTRTSR